VDARRIFSRERQSASFTDVHRILSSGAKPVIHGRKENICVIGKLLTALSLLRAPKTYLHGQNCPGQSRWTLEIDASRDTCRRRRPRLPALRAAAETLIFHQTMTTTMTSHYPVVALSCSAAINMSIRSLITTTTSIIIVCGGGGLSKNVKVKVWILAIVLLT